jgi:hypothetical protein
MNSTVCSESSTAAAGSSQASAATVENSAPASSRPQPTCQSENLFEQSEPLLIKLRLRVVPRQLGITPLTTTLASSGSDANGPACSSNVLPAAVIQGATAVPLNPPVIGISGPLPART